ncbi:MAG TPA: DHA2 family efflux MFS transporter permease subunit, partial [Candidatus Paceibacterota bacterium]
MTNPNENPSLKWWVLATVIVGTFLGRIDQNIVNLALPKMISDFGVTVSTAGWIATAYILANAVFVPIWGKLGDTIGRKKVYVFGFSIFILGSVLAGLAWNFPSMIAFRIIQAIASSADYPTAMAILAVTFPAGKERAQALGIWSSSFAAASVFGPLIGGPMIDTFGWRSVFMINLPIGLIGLAMALTFIHESVSERKTVVFDWWGATALGIVLSAMVLVLDKGLEWGWMSLNSGLCYATIIAFSFIFYTIERNHEEPIVDLKFFTIPLFVNALLNNFIMFVGLMGSIFLIPIFAQTFLGYNATQTGLLFIPMAIGLMVAAPIGGSLIGRVKASYIIFWSTLGAAFAIYLYTFIDAKTTVWQLSIPLAIMSLTMGFGMAQRTAVVAAAVPQREIGIASAILALVRNTAGAFGIALFGTILQYSEKARVLSIAQNSVIRSTDPEVIKQGIALIELKAQVAAYGDV